MIIKAAAGRSPNPDTQGDYVDRVFIAIKNSTGGALSAGYGVCFNVTNNASANGIDIQKPLTSALPAYAGVVADDEQTTDYSIADTDYGLAQAYGFCNVAFFRAESNGGNQIEGVNLGPITGQWFLQSNGRSFEFGPAVLMSRVSATTFEDRVPVFLRNL